MKCGARIVVCKRGGSREAFSTSKLHNCLWLVLRDTGGNQALAEPLARAVRAHVAAQTPENPVSTAYIFRCALSGLLCMGAREAARRLATHHHWRAAQRRKLRIVDGTDPVGPGVPWSRTRLAGNLRRKHELRPPVARLLSGRVEQHLLGLGYESVTMAMIDELVRAELRAWGLDERAGKVDAEPPPPAALETVSLEHP